MKVNILILLVVLNLFGFACKEKNEHHHHEDNTNIPASSASEGSLYDLDEIWTTQNGELLLLSQFKNEPILISMFYASCQSVCPRIVSDMQKLAKEIQLQSGKTPKLVLVSFDPDKDSPNVLLEYSSKMKLDQNWILLNGSNDSVRILSVILGINYKKTDSGDFNHSTVISLISEKGLIKDRIEGIGADQSSIIDYFK